MTATDITASTAVDAGHWRERLTALLAQHGVPGAALGILANGAITDVAAGLLSVRTLVDATPDSLFQIGSISKVWTTTLVMQLVDEGTLTLDTPVAEIIEDFAVVDAEVARTVTVRHLLTHSSGIDGDVFTDTGRGDDCVQRYVEKMREIGQNHPLGATFSYCNSGFILAGRIVEVLTGKTWDGALHERIISPLGLTATVTLPEEALLFRAAVGHVGEPGERPTPAPVWVLPRSAGPAGLITARVHDLLVFAATHLAGGVAPNGTRILSEESTEAMMQWEVDLPDPTTLGDSWGLGWIRFGWDGHRLIGHDGGTIGQAAFLRVLPGADVAVALLTNGGDARGLYQDLFTEIFAEIAGVAMPAPAAPPETPVESGDLSRYVGRYSRAGVDTEVYPVGDELWLRATTTGPLAELQDKPEEYQLVPVDADGAFVMRQKGAPNWTPARFYALADGSRYVHYGVRANPWVDDPAAGR